MFPFIKYLRFQKTAFTLMELLIVVMILPIIAAFAIANYHNAVLRSHEREAILGLMNIRAGAQIDQSKFVGTSSSWPGTYSDLNAVNNRFGINVTDLTGKMSYGCTLSAPSRFVCFAKYNAGVWGLRSDSNTNKGIPYCYLGTCPKCKNACSGGCSIP